MGSCDLGPQIFVQSTRQGYDLWGEARRSPAGQQQSKLPQIGAQLQGRSVKLKSLRRTVEEEQKRITTITLK